MEADGSSQLTCPQRLTRAPQNLGPPVTASLSHVSSTSLATLQEGEDLSFILNGRRRPTGKSSDLSQYLEQSQLNNSASQLFPSSPTRSTRGLTSPQRTTRPLSITSPSVHFHDQSTSFMSPPQRVGDHSIDAIEKDLEDTQRLVTQLEYKRQHPLKNIYIGDDVHIKQRSDDGNSGATNLIPTAGMNDTASTTKRTGSPHLYSDMLMHKHSSSSSRSSSSTHNNDQQVYTMSTSNNNQTSNSSSSSGAMYPSTPPPAAPSPPFIPPSTIQHEDSVSYNRNSAAELRQHSRQEQGQADHRFSHHTAGEVETPIVHLNRSGGDGNDNRQHASHEERSNTTNNYLESEAVSQGSGDRTTDFLSRIRQNHVMRKYLNKAEIKVVGVNSEQSLNIQDTNAANSTSHYVSNTLRGRSASPTRHTTNINSNTHIASSQHHARSHSAEPLSPHNSTRQFRSNTISSTESSDRNKMTLRDLLSTPNNNNNTQRQGGASGGRGEDSDDEHHNDRTRSNQFSDDFRTSSLSSQRSELNATSTQDKSTTLLYQVTGQIMTLSGLDQRSLVGESDYIAGVSSAMQCLMKFQKWLFTHCFEVYAHSSSTYTRNVAVMLHTHLVTLSDFATDAFGLEQWLRDKMKLLVIAAAKSFIFRSWALYSGVTSAARLHFRKTQLRLGMNNMLEFCVKQGMTRRNSLHALAAKR
eukprot:gene31531-38945_t